jgi:GTP 3',8-cyclase
MPPPLSDRHSRPLRDLRVSVTDRCNFRCTYCMPRDVYGRDFEFLDHSSVLTFEEILRSAGLLAALGVTKIRITGGEPLIRRNLEDLVAGLARIEGIEDLTLTTNGSLLARKAVGLKEAGLSRLSVSLDSLRDEVFREMNDVGFPVARVLDGIDAALDVGFRPIKVNMVVKRGVNEESVLPMARRFRGTGVILRFIEYMDVGSSNGWQLEDVVPAADLLARVSKEFPLEPVDPLYRGEVARRYRYLDGSGEIGLIASVTRPFCSTCTRLRLSSDGQLYTCLFGTTSRDLRALLRGGAKDEEITAFLTDLWQGREDRYSEERTEATARRAAAGEKKVEMPRVGG